MTDRTPRAYNAAQTPPAPLPWPVSVAGLVAAGGLLLWLVVPGLRWGLPSEERNRLTLGEDRSAWRAPEISSDEIEKPWEYYPDYVRGGSERKGRHPRSAFNVLRSYHPDEYVFLKSMPELRRKLFPGFFGWPALHFYVVGAALKISSWLGFATLMPGKVGMNFYFKNPEAMARLYEIGRIVTLLFAAGCIIVVWKAGGRLFGAEGGIAAALLLAATPLFTMNTRFLTADVPMLFWISLVLLFSTHILSGGGRKWYLLGGAALGLAAATRYQGALAAFLIAGAHGMRPLDVQGCRERIRAFFATKNLRLAAGISVLVFLACNPYIVLRPGQFSQEFLGELHGSRAPLSRFLIDVLLFGGTGFGIMYGAAIVAALLLMVVRRDQVALFLFLGLGVPALLLLAGRPVMARYLMPVLLLPVLAVAWAFATIHRRGMELNKPATKVAGPILLVIPLLLAGLQSCAYSRLFTDPEMDTRTRAGQWITQDMPEGSSIGVVSEPWQFQLPPLNLSRHKIAILDPDKPEALFERGTPDYVITSDLQFPPVGSGDYPLSAKAEEFWKEVREGGQTYSVAQRFEAWPFGQKDLLRVGPHDMRYENPAIVISARRKAP